MTSPLPQSDAENPARLEDLVGYLNFSSGASDPRFLSHLNEVFASLEQSSSGEDCLPIFCKRLRETIAQLNTTGGAFQDVRQARSVIDLLEHRLLPAYRAFHQDLLFHQHPADLWRPFFLGRALEALLAEGSPWDEPDRIVEGALAQLNNYVGYRPVATLASGDATAPYPHEFVRPIPLYIRGAGIAAGRYQKLLQLAIEILQQADPDICARAWFDFQQLDEIALDPRAYDFDHPVNRRPNYHFGQWDPHQITRDGTYCRFVIQQVTLDALLSRCEVDSGVDEREERTYESAAVLAGTMLMASGTSGDGPGRHDSSVTLSTLLPHIAAYRDDFYEQLVMEAEGKRGVRLREEAKRYHQPFGGARQHLNHELARRRALQLQRVHLAHLFARLGYPEAAKKQADSVRVASARMVSEIYCQLTAGHDAIDRNELASVADHLSRCEQLMHRAIECGALVDPWNVVGFAGNFSLFPALENTVHDWRVDELIELMEQILDLCARAWSEAAAVDNAVLEETFSTLLSRLAAWWDQFATSTVEEVKPLVAKQIEVSANLVAGALNAWHKAGTAAGDIAFWRMFVDQFDSSKAFQLVIEALLDHGDTVAARALMMQWVSQNDRTPLEQGDSSFRRLAFRWLATVEANQLQDGEDRWDQVVKFFDYLEANAEQYWQVPSLMLDLDGDSIFDEMLDEVDGAVYFEEDEEELEEDEGELFEAAYEEMVYRDSTDDGHEGDLVDDDSDWEHSEWEYEVQRLEQRLSFLTAVAGLWKQVTVRWGAGKATDGKSEHHQVFAQWLATARTNFKGLLELLETVYSLQFALPTSSHESLIEYDRLRSVKESLIQKIIAASVETADTERLLAAARDSETSDSGELLDRATVQVLRGVLLGDADTIRSHWDSFIQAIQSESLLYIPHVRGGKPKLIVKTRTLQQLLYDLLGWLPKLGLIRETCQLLQLAQQMEREHPVGQGAVTEFDRLFENGYQAIVRAMVTSIKQHDTDSQSNPQADHLLVDALKKFTEQQLERWLGHSHSLRLSVVESLAEEDEWQRFVGFVERYGGDLFTQRFMSLGNLRGIMHQGVDSWLESLEESPDAADEFALIDDLQTDDQRDEAVEMLSLAIEAVVENYQVYLDYNTTTTQSDRGELLYTLIDFLRLRTAYDRMAWNLKPVVWVHEILVRHGRVLAAELWCRTFAERTAEAADAHLAEMRKLNENYGMHLPSIADRLGERFVRPLAIDRIKALVEPALTAPENERLVAFEALEHEIASLASEPSGTGLDLPDWLAALENEVTTARSQLEHHAPADRLAERLGQVQLDWEDLIAQLEEPS